MTSLKFKVNKVLNRDRKNWPVTVKIIEPRSNNDFSVKWDRGRRVQDSKTEEPVYEFMKQGDTSPPIPQTYVKRDKTGHERVDVVKIQTSDGPIYFPANSQLSVKAEGIKGSEELEEWAEENTAEGEIGVETVIELSRFIDVGKKELERHFEITQSDDKKWYQAPIFWMIGGAIAMGLFLVMAGIGAQKVLSPAAETAAQGAALLALWRGRT